MLLFEETDLIERALLRGVIGAAEANDMVRPGGTFQRDLLDRVLLNLCKSYLGEGEVDAFIELFHHYSQIIQDDSSLFEGVAPSVSTALISLSQDYRQSSRVTKKAAIDNLLQDLSSGLKQRHEAALTIRTRILAGRVNDDATHPYIAVYKMRWEDIDVSRMPQTPEIVAVSQAPFDTRDWELGERDDRSITEEKIRRACKKIHW